MGYKTLFAHVCPGRDNSGVYAVSGQMAKMFGANVTGISGARLSPPLAEVPVAEMMGYERKAAEESLAALEKEFRAALRQAGIETSWRSSCNFEPISDFIAREARAADLIVTGPESKSLLDRLEEPRLGPLVMAAGRPVLIVRPDQTELTLNHVVVAWKDTREARRAVADAMPLLKKANRVLVIEACAKEALDRAGKRTMDVTDWLKAHGIQARAWTEVQESTDLEALHAILNKEKCDLLVAGAYGHTRLHEWVFGGVTMDLLLRSDRCVLLSH